MKLFTSVGLLVGFVVAESLDVACPTVTQQILNPSCRKRCNSADCTFVTTVQNPCGCPATVPTATLLAPCEAGCPYDGCAVEFRSIQQSCTPTSSHWTRRPRPTTTTTTITKTGTSSDTPSITFGITTLPPPTTSTEDVVCPTVTHHTQPADCTPLRCPVPSCTYRETMSIPCGCDGPETVLYVQGCSTACPDGCATRTSTVTATDC